MIASMQKRSFAIRRVGGRYATAVWASSAHCFARHTHDEYGVGVMLEGAQRSWSGRGAVEARAGDLITVNPGEVHDGAPLGESRTWAMLYLAQDRMRAIVSDIREGKPAGMEFTDPVVHERHTADSFTAAYTALVNSDDEAAAEPLMLLIAGLLHGARTACRTTSPLMSRVKARIDDDPTGHHPLEELARDVGISRFRTLRGFADLTGLTPHAYLVQRRLDLARSMIRSGSALADAAIAAGFSDQSHLHRSFTSRYGLTPGAYAAAML